MNADQRFTLLILIMGLLFTIVSALIGVIWRFGSKAGSINEKLTGVVSQIEKNGRVLDEHIKWHLERNRGR